MKKGYIDITVVLDRSGSMESVRADTIGGFNTFLAEQKALPGEATFTLVQFDNVFDFVVKGANIKNVAPLTSETFVPRGSTALMDAVGRAINEAGARLSAMNDSDRPEKVVFVVITDGHENASKEFHREKISEMVKHQQEKYAWEFVFLGADQDAIFAGGSIGIDSAKCMAFAGNSVGVRSSYSSVSGKLSSFRSGTSATMDFDDDDRNAQKAAGVKN